MTIVKCPSCGNELEVAEKKSALPWVIGCLGAVVVIPIIIAVIGLLAAIAIPSFMKARTTSQMNACVNNMRMIDAAKEQWAMATDADVGQEVDTTEVNKYLRNNAAPICPAEGTYTYHPVRDDPECSVHGLLSAPREYRDQSGTR